MNDIGQEKQKDSSFINERFSVVREILQRRSVVYWHSFESSRLVCGQSFLAAIVTPELIEKGFVPHGCG